MQRFTPCFESLYESGVPEWFLNAKFGIWSHWGAQSVPMCGDWYARNMYIEGTPQYLYHLRNYGHPSVFGYKDICALWKAENFDPEGLMDLYYKAGARYFVAQAMHHDHFFNYPSKYNKMNCVNMGPKKDICGLWHKAAKRRSLPFGLTEHLGASFSWWRFNKGSDTRGAYKGVPYDGADINYRGFYHDNACHGTDNPSSYEPWYTDNAPFRDYWLNVMKELIDIYTPEFLYSDGALPFGEHWQGEQSAFNPEAYTHGLEAVAYLYNAQIEKYGENRAVYLQKDRRPEVYKVGVLDIEKSQLPKISETPWHTDTCIGSWFYDSKQEYKSPQHIIEILADVISKNGAMLLNILQKPDGSIDEEARYILTELAAWFSVCAEAVYGTRPWKKYGEGTTRVVIDGFTESKTPWNETDIRFTKKDNTVYAFLMGNPSGAAVIRSFNEGERVAGARVLGAGNAEFTHKYGVLTVKLPERMPAGFVNCIAVELQNN